MTRNQTNVLAKQMYKHHVSIEGWENGWSDRENERK